MMYVISAFSFAVFGLGVTGELMIPATICKRSSNDYSACLTRAAQESWPQFVKGLPEFDSPPLDPLLLSNIKAAFDRDNIRGEITVSNLTINGLTKAHILDVKPYFFDDNFQLKIYVSIPKIVVNGDCNAEGNLGVFRMIGKGRFNTTIDVVTGIWDLIGPVINDTWTVEHFRNIPSVKKLKIYFKDFFGDSPEINDIVVNFVNEYWPMLYRTMLPTMAESWDPWLASLSNLIFSKISFSKLFQVY